MLGLLQGFAAGLMLSISFFDLAHNAINPVGFLKGNLWFFAGVIFFALVSNFIPEPSLAPISGAKGKTKDGDDRGKDIMKKHRRQVLFSGIITAVGISLHNFPEGMAVFLGSMKIQVIVPRFVAKEFSATRSVMIQVIVLRFVDKEFSATRAVVVSPPHSRGSNSISFLMSFFLFMGQSGTLSRRRYFLC